MKLKDYNELIGKRVGNLVVLGLGERIKTPSRTLTSLSCKCDCGNVKDIYTHHVKSGLIKSCGCQWMPSRIKHELSEHPLYKVWQSMKRRCNNQDATGYNNYGGRGIRVCERWNSSFENFLMDVGERPSLNHSIDRPNNDGDYGPDNFRWATRREQSLNRRTCTKVEIKGITRTITEWAEISGIRRGCIWERLNRGWSAHDAVYTPVQSKGINNI